jgi:hypothetical protein
MCVWRACKDFEATACYRVAISESEWVVMVAVVGFWFGVVAYSGFVNVGKCQCDLSFPKPLLESPLCLVPVQRHEGAG